MYLPPYFLEHHPGSEPNPYRTSKISGVGGREHTRIVQSCRCNQGVIDKRRHGAEELKFKCARWRVGDVKEDVSTAAGFRNHGGS